MSTILVVDDLPANRQVLVTLLRRQGHRMLEAANGAEALAEARAERPNLVITDVLMPVMSGYELVRQIRLDPDTSLIPVLFCTAHYGEREARALALSIGASDVLAKPIDPVDVLRTVAGMLSDGAPGVTPVRGVSIAANDDVEHLRLDPDQPSQTADLRAANAHLRALINIGLELATERDSERRLQRVCFAARDLFAATYVAVGILDRHDGTVQQLVSSGVEPANWLTLGDAGSGILGAVVADRRARRGERPGTAPVGLQSPPLHPDVEPFLAAPIASPAHVYGWICLVGNEGRTFTEEDEQLVLALAGQLGRVHALEDEIQPAADTALPPPPPGTRAQTVLVVEDAEALRELTRRLLERQGYTVFAAANADEAVWLFEQRSSIDVLLTDVVMPGASGPDLTRRLIERCPTMKVIYMSGYTEEAIVHHGVLNAGIAFLHKPFTSDSLCRKIQEVLDQ